MIKSISLSLLLLLTGVVYAQTTTVQTKTVQRSGQTEQMLQQIQKLQQTQRAQQKIALQQQNQQSSRQVSAVSAPTSAQIHLNPNYQGQGNGSMLSGTSRYRKQNVEPANKFPFPYQDSQVKVSTEMAHLGAQAFSGAVHSALPLTPGQIHRLKRIYTASQYAAAAPAGTPPKPTATSLYVNLSPGASPPAVSLSQGFVTSLVFLDQTGAPWPIVAYDLGDPRAFNIAWDKKDNVLMIQAKTLYTYGNLAVRLRGMNTPIMLTLIPGQRVVEYRVDITVPGYGPAAKLLPIETGLPAQVTPLLIKVLDGIPPQGSKVLTMADGIGQAWEVGGNMYLRTKYTLLSPGWLATMASADGTTAYELQKTPMLLVSKNGQVVHVKIGGF